jgi:ligand-binding sensor domain-containing protein
MPKIKRPFHNIKILIVITLCVINTSCNRQENNKIKQDVTNETNTTSHDSNLENNQSNNQNTQTSFQLLNFDNQISDVIRTVFQDSKGNIWFGTQSGAFKHNGKSLIHIASIKSESGHGVTIKDITEDKDGRIWFGHTGGISMINGESTTNYFESDGLLNNDVWCITTDKNDHVWIGTIEGVCKFDGSQFTAFEIPEGKIDTTRGISSKKMIHDIMEDSQGRMWFSTNGGVYIKDNDGLINISESDGLKTSFVNKVIEDKNGRFWISTTKGLFHYDNKTLKNITEGIVENFKGTGSIMQDSNGNIWFNSNMRDIYSFDGENFTKYRITEGDSGPAPFKIYEDQQKRLWFVGFGGAYRYENKKFINITENGPF